MKFLKKSIQIILPIIFIGIIFRGWIYRHSVTYQSIAPRSNYYESSPQLLGYLDKKTQGEKMDGIQEIVKKSLSITSDQLHFSSKSKVIDPNKLLDSKATHCVGYASFFSTTCNYLLQKHQLDDEWIVQPQAGQLHFFGYNIHPYFNSSFFKDHDFVILKNKKTGVILAVDPSLYDYFFVGLVTSTKLQ